MTIANDAARDKFLDQVATHVLSVEQQVQPEDASPEAFRVRSIEQAVTGVLAIIDGTAEHPAHLQLTEGAPGEASVLVSGTLANAYSGRYSHIKASYLKQD